MSNNASSDHQVPISSCPTCGKKMDGAFNIESNDPPKSGDITICENCEDILAFDDTLHLRLANDDELVEIAGDETFKQALMFLAKAKGRLGPKETT